MAKTKTEATKSRGDRMIRPNLHLLIVNLVVLRMQYSRYKYDAMIAGRGVCGDKKVNLSVCVAEILVSRGGWECGWAKSSLNVQPPHADIGGTETTTEMVRTGNKTPASFDGTMHS